MKPLLKIFVAACVISCQACSNKEPFHPPTYHAIAYVIGEEKCSVDSNYNYWLLDLSVKNNSSENGDSITYHGVKYDHVFKTLSTDYTLHRHGNKVEFDFSFLTNDHIKTQQTQCDAINAETFSLIDIYLLNVKEVN